MKKYFISIMILALAMSGCNKKAEDHKDDHAEDEAKLKITAYNDEFELFAEADPFVIGEKCNVLSHFSHFPSFTALENGSVTIRLITGGKEVTQNLDKPTRKGIYSFDIVPENEGTGKLIFDIKTEKGTSQLIFEPVFVYSEKSKADEEAHKLDPSKTNTIVFTKEQSWKMDFATSLPDYGSFGQVIRTIAQVNSAQGDEVIVAAKTDGIIFFKGENLSEGTGVSSGKVLFTVSANGLADNNSMVRFTEAQNNYSKAKADYERQKELAIDKIVSDKELLNAKKEYENTKVIFESFSSNFSSSGQSIVCPMSGYLKKLYVENGQFVNAGQPLISVTKNKKLMLQADVQQKYVPVLSMITTANICIPEEKKAYTLEELNGKVISFGKNTNDDNYLIPVSLEIDNVGSFVTGGFVELYLKVESPLKSISVPVEALLEEQGSYFVMVQINPELFEKREVSIGGTDGIKTEIIKGISKDERVITKGAILVKLAQATNALDPHAGHVH
ncbi:MAG TPA: efflux RND transporter periplasmic adaptor subunit [Bacteroidales bacterium]|nr:MAG: Efflux transporter, RND family, MFP subunit [candidate division TM6 bacterium GW2011_GWF2_33_332]HBS86281.1 efflux RND transporter periplasmic adaptor subunit [Bacteroidales bacterium]